MAGAGGEAYAHWVRRAIRKAMSGHEEDIGVLFGSSVDEPVELLRRTVRAGFGETITSRYTSVFVSGNPFVIEQLAQRYSVSTDSVLPTTGATGALSLLYRTFLSPGDHVLVESPGFDLFADIAHALHVDVDLFKRRGDRFEVDPDEVGARIRKNTRLIVMTNLHNPSGMLMSNETMLEVARVAERHGVKVIVDEVYGGYVDASEGVADAATLAPNLISVSSLTKVYGLSTLRCGWIVADPEVIAPVRNLSDQFEFGISKLSHAVAALVMENNEPYEEYWQGLMREARPVMQGYFDEWCAAGLMSGVLPDYGCVAFPSVSGVADTKALAAWLADRHGVIVVPGELFGGAGHVRIGFASPKAELERALAHLTAGLKEYREYASTRKHSA